MALKKINKKSSFRKYLAFTIILFSLIVVYLYFSPQSKNGALNRNSDTSNYPPTKTKPVSSEITAIPTLSYNGNIAWNAYKNNKDNVYFEYPSEVEISSPEGYIVTAYLDDNLECGGAYGGGLKVNIFKPQPNPNNISLDEYVKERFLAENETSEVKRIYIGDKPAISIRYVEGRGKSDTPYAFVVERNDGFIYIEATTWGRGSENYPFEEVFNKMWTSLRL